MNRILNECPLIWFANCEWPNGRQARPSSSIAPLVHSFPSQSPRGALSHRQPPQHGQLFGPLSISNVFDQSTVEQPDDKCPGKRHRYHSYKLLSPSSLSPLSAIPSPLWRYPLPCTMSMSVAVINIFKCQEGPKVWWTLMRHASKSELCIANWTL